MAAKMMRPSQVADRLGLNVRTIWRWIEAGNFAPGTVTNLGSKEHPRYMIQRTEVDRICDKGLCEAALNHPKPT